VLSRWREQVCQLPSAKHLDNPTLTDHVPLLVDELTEALFEQSSETIAEALVDGSPPIHGAQRFVDGFDIAEIVAEYNILRGCIHDLADAHGLTLQGRPFHILNRVLDGAIGSAVQAYATEKALEVQQRRQEYLAFVAHDLRTPLNAISLAARVLERTCKSPDQLAESEQMLRSLRRNVKQLDTLVAKVIEENTNLVTETGVRIERRSFDLWPLVESLIHDLHPVAGTSSTNLVNRVPEDLIVEADANLLRRIFQNLIANSIRYTPHGEIEIGARGIANDGGAECWVRDNGSGVPVDRLDRIFDPLESDSRKAEGSGTGLGLAIVKTFVEAHDGQVSVESAEGAGSTFTFTLPARRAP
jgi:two-component system phosphate regulon sensor histidine kinase PhoR